MFKVTKGLLRYKDLYSELPERLFWSMRKQKSTGIEYKYLCAKCPEWTQRKVSVQLAYICDRASYSALTNKEKGVLLKSIEQLVRLRFEG